MIWKQMNKTGNTDFQLRDVQIDLEDGLFVPVGELNALRRQALEGMKGGDPQPVQAQACELCIFAGKDRIVQCFLFPGIRIHRRVRRRSLGAFRRRGTDLSMDHSGGETQIFPMDQAKYGRISTLRSRLPCGPWSSWKRWFPARRWAASTSMLLYVPGRMPLRSMKVGNGLT